MIWNFTWRLLLCVKIQFYGPICVVQVYCSKQLELLLFSSHIALLGGMRLLCCASQEKLFQQWIQGWVRWLPRWLKQAEKMLTKLSKQPAKPSRKALGPGCQAVYAPHFTLLFWYFWFNKIYFDLLNNDHCQGVYYNHSNTLSQLKRLTSFNTWVGIAIECRLKLVQVMVV